MEKVKEDIAHFKETPANEDNYQHYKVINIQRYEALKEVLGNIITVEIPTENRVYSFQTVLRSEECLEKLNEVLETISIE